MSNNKIRPLLEKAKAHEKRYDWVGAADFYDQASNIILDNFLKNAELIECVGYCFLKAAFQAKTNKEFRNFRLKLGISQQQMADIVGFSFGTAVHKIETGDRPVTKQMANHIATLERNIKLNQTIRGLQKKIASLEYQLKSKALEDFYKVDQQYKNE